MNTTTLVDISKIHADPNQPRKFFDIARLATLKKSIKSQGIVNPLIVEQNKDGFLLVDGERRYRCAKDLGMKEVPIVIVKAKDSISRRIEQFHIQEMHEGWNPMEKAQVISDLCDELKKPFKEVCEMLGIASRTAHKYAALSKLATRQEFADKNISLDFAEHMYNLNTFVKKLKNDEMEESFNLTDQRKLEKQIIKHISDGVFTNYGDVVHLKDTFRCDPKTIEKFIGGADPEELYIKSKAKSGYHLRNAVNSAGYVQTHIAGFLSNPNVKLSVQDVNALRNAKNQIEKLLALAGKI